MNRCECKPFYLESSIQEEPVTPQGDQRCAYCREKEAAAQEAIYEMLKVLNNLRLCRQEGTLPEKERVGMIVDGYEIFEKAQAALARAKAAGFKI